MDASPTQIELTELADRAGVSIRTVRYYIQQGLLSKPEARGPGAHYTEDHLERLQLIKRLQKEHLPLAEIRRRLESGVAEPPSHSARDYIRTVLGKPDQVRVSQPPAPYTMSEEPLTTSRSQWERITLAPDIELHIRRPLPRLVNRQVERLIDVARDILDEDT
ncbi:MAG: MerR family transcriptional regulator [bacterium]